MVKPGSLNLEASVNTMTAWNDEIFSSKQESIKSTEEMAWIDEIFSSKQQSIKFTEETAWIGKYLVSNKRV